MIMNKKGSHIGVIISFIIFIGMIVFLYSVLSPNLNFGQDKSTLVNSLQLELKSSLSGDLTTVSVYANDTSSNCVNFSDFALNANLGSLRAIAQNQNGKVETSGVSGNGFYIIKSESGEKFFTIYDSTNFSQSAIIPPAESCTTLDYGPGAGNYTISQEKTGEYVFESAIKSMISKYGTGDGINYGVLKSQLGVSGQNNFGFDFIYQNGTSIGTLNQIQSSTNVYSQSFPIDYVSVNGSIESGSLVVRVW